MSEQASGLGHELAEVNYLTQLDDLDTDESHAQAGVPAEDQIREDIATKSDDIQISSAAMVVDEANREFMEHRAPGTNSRSDLIGGSWNAMCRNSQGEYQFCN